MKKGLTYLLTLSLLCAATLAEAALPPVKPGVPGKHRGDIIAPMLDEQVAAWCDFNKQIVVTRTNILCAYVGDKTTPVAVRAVEPRPYAKKWAKAKRLPKDLTPTPYEMSEYGDV